MSSYHGFGPRPPGLPLSHGKIDFADSAGVARMLEMLAGAELPPVEETAAQPFVGITTDGHPQTGLFTLGDEDADPAPAVSAAEHYLSLLRPADARRATCPIDAPEWQLWTNAFLSFPEHGLRLQDLSGAQRTAALSVVAATLSRDGFDQIRAAMRLNGELGDFVDSYRDTLTEWCYWFTLFGDPSQTEPWGWQLQGHHIDVHCLVLGGQRVITPTFLGVEFHGEQLFADHRRHALEFANSLTAAQRSRAVLYEHITADELPALLAGPVDGRHRAGAGRDNLVLPYEGLSGEALTPGQRELLLGVFEPYLAGLPDGHAQHRRAQVLRHLDDCWFSWIGGRGTDDAFYYKLHSPVILVEYDNHPGIFLDNDDPEPFHVHTIVRTPNGGDYGKNLLAQHYAAHHQAGASHP